MRIGWRNAVLAGFCVLLLSGCERTIGASQHDDFMFTASAENLAVLRGQRDAATILARRFTAEVPDTIVFEPNSTVLDAEALHVLAEQASWMRRFPELRFAVTGFVEPKAGERWDQALALRRARVVADELVRQGVDRHRLSVLAARAPAAEGAAVSRDNGAAVLGGGVRTRVVGFLPEARRVMSGRYAEIIYRGYLESATAEPGSATSATEMF